MSEESESHIEHIDPAERYKRKKQIEKDLSTVEDKLVNKLTCTVTNCLGFSYSCNKDIIQEADKNIDMH